MDKGWTRDNALKELRALAAASGDGLTRERRLSANHTRWVARTLAVLEEVFGRESRYYLTFAYFTWGATGSFIVGGPADPGGAWNPQAAIERKEHKAYLEQLESARGLLLAAVDHLERSDLASVYEGKDTAPEASAIMKIISLAEHKLRKAIRSEPQQEDKVQDAFENLLIGADVPYSRETESIEYSSKTYTPDFTVPKIGLAIEVKLCSRRTREKEIIAEINDDIIAYRTKYPNLVFIVYDLGVIRDVDRFKRSLEDNEDVVVVVVKH
jgi:hypothetical protein